jgi:hypothetical protein
MATRAFHRWVFVPFVVMGLLLASLVVFGGGQGGRARRSRSASEHSRGGAPEVQQELSEQTAERQEALEEANAQGLDWQVSNVTSSPARGWAGEMVADPNADDWEPAIAADPNAPYVYLLTTHFTDKPCPGNCPYPHISLHISSDGGKTWQPQTPLCACKGSWQYDPQIEVVPDGPAAGDVYAAYLNGFNVVFLKSTDHGGTWSDPIQTYGNVSWNDKPALAMSDDGEDVYISWNGPTGGDPWVAQSHDGGATWTQTKLVDSKGYFFAFDADVLHDGTVLFAESDVSYTAPGTNPEGVVRHHVFISRDEGATWEDRVVATVEVGEPCIAEGCPSDFYIGHDALSADDQDNLVMLYDGATIEFGPQRIYSRYSTDEGRTWSPPTALSVSGENATAPAVESQDAGDVRAWYMQTSDNDDPDAWNVFYRSSSDGGRTWAPPEKISDATSGTGYKQTDGFDEVYGDYGEIAITNTGESIATWGEGFSWAGPGGVWFNRQV